MQQQMQLMCGQSFGMGGVSAERLLTELQYQRSPILIPAFPKVDPIKKYRDWRGEVHNYTRTHPLVEDSVKLNKLKKACENSEASSVIDLYTSGVDSFQIALDALDARFLIARVIVSSYVATAVNLPLGGGTGRTEQAKHLKTVLDTYKSIQKNIEGVCRESLTDQLKREPTELEVANKKYDALLLGLLYRNLNDDMKARLSTSMNMQSTELPNVQSVLIEIEKRVVAIQSSDSGKPAPRIFAFNNQFSNNQGSGSNCAVHSDSNHSTLECKTFKSEADPRARLEMINKSKSRICRICLTKLMSQCDCKVKNRTCQKCGGKHHRMICFKTTNKPEKFIRKEPLKTALSNSIVATTKNDDSQAVIGTILLQARTSNGEFIVLRAMTDDGSQISFITEQAATLLRCPRQKVHKIVKSADGQKLMTIKEEISIFLQNHDRQHALKKPHVLYEVGIISKLPTLPSQQLQLKVPNKFKGKINFADPNFEAPSSVDILLGSKDWARIKIGGSHRIGQSWLQNTIFGHVVQGAVDPSTDTKITNHLVVSTILSAEENRSVKEDLQQVFEYEIKEAEKESYAEDLFETLHYRQPDGRYVVPLIFGLESQLGDSYNVCFRRNQRTFQKLNDVQTKEFLKILSNYQTDGIISLCSDKKEGNYYAPFVLVWRSSLTTPLRICLDDSQKSSNGLSVNDIQLVGKKLQPDLMEHLLRFRQNPVAIIADIAQMYLQILIREEDRKFQRSIINLPGHHVQEIEYNTLLFGATCAPFLSQRVIQSLAKDEAENYPLGAAVLRESAYIDDVIFSTKDNQTAKKTLLELIGITSSAHFKLHKVTSNRQQVLKDIPFESTLDSVEKNDTTKVLGINWDHREKDEFFFKIISNQLKF